MTTITQLMSDNWAWAVACKFNHIYNMGMTRDDIQSEINEVITRLYRKIEQRQLNFTFDDDVQVLKYFRFSVRTHFCTVARKHKMHQHVLTYDDLFWNQQVAPPKTPPSFDVIQSTHRDRAILRYCLQLNKASRIRRYISPEQRIYINLNRIHRRFGDYGVGLIYRCYRAVYWRDNLTPKQIVPKLNLAKGVLS